MSASPRFGDLYSLGGLLAPGSLNAITDVAGVRVGHAFAAGDAATCSGVTTVLPHGGSLHEERVYAGVSVFNGAGELTGRSVIEEWGLLAGPIALCSTRHVGVVYDAVSEWMERNYELVGIEDVVIPIVGECDDSFLAGRGAALRPGDVWRAINSARDGRVDEGCVGAGAGMQFFGYKGGIGTSSRLVPAGDKTYTVGVLLNTNYGNADQLLVSGGRLHATDQALRPDRSLEGSCIAIVATDAPLLPNQLRRLARRVDAGLARTGSVANDGSGEIALAFSTARKVGRRESGEQTSTHVGQGHPWRESNHINGLFQAVVEATEEAAWNAAAAAVTTVGRTGETLTKLPLDEVLPVARSNVLGGETHVGRP